MKTNPYDVIQGENLFAFTDNATRVVRHIVSDYFKDYKVTRTSDTRIDVSVDKDQARFFFVIDYRGMIHFRVIYGCETMELLCIDEILLELTR